MHRYQVVPRDADQQHQHLTSGVEKAKHKNLTAHVTQGTSHRQSARWAVRTQVGYNS